jgi:(R,R)-butanediol dehydrogenase/meso-butanediol dehydrogenase/diacetyl reductase
MPSQMQVAFLEGPERITIAEAPVPRPGPGEVLLRVALCGLCGTDVHAYRLFPYRKPVVMGHEMVGEIAELGSDVENWKVGERVALNPLLRCGSCFWCRRGQWDLCPSTLRGSAGGFAQFRVAEAVYLHRMPPSLQFTEAALTEPVAVALHAVGNSGLRLGDWVVIYGAGAIGLLTLVVVKEAGAQEVYTVEVSSLRAQVARTLGADRVLIPGQEEVLSEIQKRTGVGADVVFECAGAAGAVESAGKVVRRGGEIVFVGSSLEPVPVPLRAWLVKGIRCRFMINYGDEFAQALEWLGRKRVSSEKVISGVIPLKRIATDGFQPLMASEAAGRILVDPWMEG